MEGNLMGSVTSLGAKTSTVSLSTTGNYTPVFNGADTLIVDIAVGTNVLVLPPAAGRNGERRRLFFKNTDGDAVVSFEREKWNFSDRVDKDLPAVIDENQMSCDIMCVDGLSTQTRSPWCLIGVNLMKSPGFHLPIYDIYDFIASASVTGWTPNDASIVADLWDPTGTPPDAGTYGGPAGVLSNGAAGNASMILTPQPLRRAASPYAKFIGNVQVASIPVGVTATVYCDLLTGGVTANNRQVLAVATSAGIITDNFTTGLSWFKDATEFGFTKAVWDATRFKVECVYTGSNATGSVVQIDGRFRLPGDYGTRQVWRTSLIADVRQNYSFTGTTCSVTLPATNFPDIPMRGEAMYFFNRGSGSVTINGTNIYTGVTAASTAVIPTAKTGMLIFDGTNWCFTLLN
jgi:hypothetical protein